MKIISSQHYIDSNIVDEKEKALKISEATKVTITCLYAGYVDGEETAVVWDGHHTIAAAKRLGLDIEFDVVADPEGLIGEDLLNIRQYDGDYYFARTSDTEAGQFDLVW